MAAIFLSQHLNLFSLIANIDITRALELIKKGRKGREKHFRTLSVGIVFLKRSPLSTSAKPHWIFRTFLMSFVCTSFGSL